jgi:anti-sigma regulatory factor (Ser/Thr protein kinase)
MKWIVKANLEEWDVLSDTISEILDSHNFVKSEIISFTVAMEEVFVNIVNYAYTSDGGTVGVSLDMKENEVYVKFCDKGKPFNPLSVPTPNVNETSKRKPGGLGIYLARLKTDNILYEYENNENKLTLIKKFNYK